MSFPKIPYGLIRIVRENHRCSQTRIYYARVIRLPPWPFQFAPHQTPSARRTIAVTLELTKLANDHNSLAIRLRATVTRKKVAGIDVAFLLGLWFWLLNRASKLVLQITGAPVSVRCFEGVHGWPVVFSEGLNELGWRPGKIEGVCVSGEGYCIL